MLSGIDKELLYYIWLSIISLIGGILGYIKRKNEDFRYRAFFLGVISSMFTAYVVYEIVFFIFASEKFSIALGGLGAWIGTDVLLKLESGFEDMLNKKIKDK